MEKLLLSRYKIGREIGRGGMGVVYEADDSRLDRKVAIKVLREEHDGADRKSRFRQEARAASALNHPNIVTVYDIDSVDGVDYIVMEYVDGAPLKALIPPGGLPIDQTIAYATQVGSALAAAHSAGIVHRDVKPANIMVTRNGRIKVLDFGLSKLTRSETAAASEITRSAGPQTQHGHVVGTHGYMSPEQATGQAVDARADVFAFGIVVYEMLTGRRAFAGDSYWSTLRAVMEHEPQPLTVARADAPAELCRIVERCLQKDPAKRYSAAIGLMDDLALLASGSRSDVVGPPARRRRRLALATLAIIVALAGVASVPLYRWQMERSRQAGLREVERRVDVGRYGDAYRLVRQLEERMPDDAEVQQALLRLTYPSNVRTIPPGAQVFLRDYADTDGPWQLFGTSPIDNTRVPFAALRWRVAKEGFDPVEGRFLWGSARTVTLHATGASPQGMVFVSRGTANVPGAAGEVPDYWIDKYEVSNREFKKFIDEGGYRERRYWKHPFVKDGQPLTWEQAMTAFRDKTGRPGPATWELGASPEGQGDYPVAGISWYEAAAFAEFTGKRLPTVAHWQRAVGPTNFREDAAVANFGGREPEPISELRDLGPFGTYGLAGNVREWCWNPVQGKRYILGGGWNDPPYMSNRFDALPPFDRSETNGVRLVKDDGLADPAILGEVQALQGQFNLHQAVGDDVFEVYRSVYSYDRQPLEARIERVEETRYWRQEHVSVAAAYGKERVLIRLLLPKNAVPPYQTVIWFPGSYALNLGSSDPLTVPFYFDFLVQSGRAVIYPIYQGTYERRLAALAAPSSSAYRDMVIQWSKDLGRTIDYLETRSDIDSKQLAYYVLSMVGQTMPLPALEQRLKALIFVSGGLLPVSFPSEVDPINFAPRIKVPVLLLGGRYDYQSPVEDSQVPLFNLFGTPAANKSHVIVNSGHVPERGVLIREILEWLDRYLGPVKVKAG